MCWLCVCDDDGHGWVSVMMTVMAVCVGFVSVMMTVMAVCVWLGVCDDDGHGCVCWLCVCDDDGHGWVYVMMTAMAGCM